MRALAELLSRSLVHRSGFVLGSAGESTASTVLGVGTFFTSDMHVDHRNILAYCERPFGDLDSMREELAKRWNEVVGEGDRVWILGDATIGDIEQSAEYFSVLNGDIYLVPGNHDSCWSQHKRSRSHKVRSAYEDLGITIVDSPKALRLAGRSVEMSHFPFHNPQSEDQRYAEYRPQERGQWLLHGHTHGRWRQRGRQIDVGVDAWGGWPVSVGQIEELIVGGTKDLGSLAW